MGSDCALQGLLTSILLGLVLAAGASAALRPGPHQTTLLEMDVGDTELQEAERQVARNRERRNGRPTRTRSSVRPRTSASGVSSGTGSARAGGRRG